GLASTPAIASAQPSPTRVQVCAPPGPCWGAWARSSVATSGLTRSLVRGAGGLPVRAVVGVSFGERWRGPGRRTRRRRVPRRDAAVGEEVAELEGEVAERDEHADRDLAAVAMAKKEETDCGGEDRGTGDEQAAIADQHGFDGVPVRQRDPEETGSLPVGVKVRDVTIGDVER